jgi:hypothetical protein
MSEPPRRHSFGLSRNMSHLAAAGLLADISTEMAVSLIQTPRPTATSWAMASMSPRC